MRLREWQQYIEALVAKQNADVERECQRLMDQGITPAIICRLMVPPLVIDARLAPGWAPHDPPDEPEARQDAPGRAGRPPPPK